LDPCAGTGAIIKATAARKDICWWGMEIRAECAPLLSPLLESRLTIADFTSYAASQPFDVIFTNPPYSSAEDFIRVALRNARYVVMLLRLNFLSSNRRASFMRAHPPDVFILPNRPSFTSDGRTDSIEYAWFLWDTHNLERPTGHIRVLSPTPPKIRKSF
jgi:hypothetical protein